MASNRPPRRGGWFGRQSPPRNRRIIVQTPRRRVRRAAGAAAGGLTRAAFAGVGAAGQAFVESSNPKMKTIMGVDGALVTGAALALLAPMALRGASGKAIGQIGVGAFAVGVHRATEAALAKRKDEESTDQASGEEGEWA